MLKFHYKIKITRLGDEAPYETFKGEVEATDHDQATIKAQHAVFDRCKQLEREQDGMFGYDSQNIQVALIRDPQPVCMTLAEYRQARNQGKKFLAADTVTATVAELLQFEIDLGNSIFLSLKAELARFSQQQDLAPGQEAIVLYDKPRWKDPHPTQPLTESESK